MNNSNSAQPALLTSLNKKPLDALKKLDSKEPHSKLLRLSLENDNLIDNSSPIPGTPVEDLDDSTTSQKTIYNLRRRVVFADEAGKELTELHTYVPVVSPSTGRASPSPTKKGPKEIKVKQYNGTGKVIVSPSSPTSPSARKKVTLKKTKIEAFKFATDRRAEEKRSPSSPTVQNTKKLLMNSVDDSDSEDEPINPAPQTKTEIMKSFLSPLILPSPRTANSNTNNSNIPETASSPRTQMTPGSPTGVRPPLLSLRSFMSPRHSDSENDPLAKTVRVLYIPQDISKDIYERTTSTLSHNKDLQSWLGGRFRCQAWLHVTYDWTGAKTIHRRMLCSHASVPNDETSPRLELNTRIQTYFPTSSLAPRGDVVICSYMMNNRPLSSSLSSTNSSSLYWLLDYDVASFMKDLSSKSENMSFGGVNNSDWNTSPTISLLASLGDKPKKSVSTPSPTQSVGTPINAPGRPTISLRTTSPSVSKGTPVTPAVPIAPSLPQRLVIGHQRIGSQIPPLSPIKKIHTMRTLNGVAS